MNIFYDTEAQISTCGASAIRALHRHPCPCLDNFCRGFFFSRKCQRDVALVRLRIISLGAKASEPSALALSQTYLPEEPCPRALGTTSASATNVNCMTEVKIISSRR